METHNRGTVAKKLSRDEVRALLEHARQSFPHDDCLTCECFLAYVAQLGIDAGEEINSLFDEMGVDYHHAHGCMGCDPCRPADLFADYLRGQADRS
jgi:hypothetical protein